MLRPTGSQPVSLGVKPHLGPKKRYLLLSDSCGFVDVGRSLCLSFTIAAGPRQRSHSRVRVVRDSWPHFTVSDSGLPQPGGPCPRIYIPQEQRGPITPLDTWCSLRRLLLLAGLRWWYSNPPPRRQRSLSLSLSLSIYIYIYIYIYISTAPARIAQKHLFHYCVFFRCRGNVSTYLFPSNGCWTVACLHICYLAMCLYVTIHWSWDLMLRVQWQENGIWYVDVGLVCSQRCSTGQGSLSLSLSIYIYIYIYIYMTSERSSQNRRDAATSSARIFILMSISELTWQWRHCISTVIRPDKWRGAVPQVFI
jgi:hypothetical protein